MDGYKILRDVWTANGPGECSYHSAQCIWPEGNWVEASSGSVTSGTLLASTSRLDGDLYWAPAVFTGARKNDNWARCAWLWADLDPVNPTTLEQRPTIAWETSPGMYQALWRLDTPMTDYAEWAGRNRALTATTGADAGGWMGSKLLRVPGSLNFKRAERGNIPRGSVLWRDGPLYSADDFPAKTPRELASGQWPTPPYLAERGTIFRQFWPRLTLLGRHLVSRGQVGDRSLHIAITLREVMSAGLTNEECFVLLHVTSFNKFLDRPQQLWAEVLKARADAKG